jgi:hypothetical protein
MDETATSVLPLDESATLIPLFDDLPTPSGSTMDPLPLEEYAVEYALTLVGLQERDPDVTPLDAPQLVVAMMAGLSAYARTRPDYDANTDVTSILQLGVASYAQALYAAAAQLADELEQPDLFGDPFDAAVEDNLEGETDTDEDPLE